MVDLRSFQVQIQQNTFVKANFTYIFTFSKVSLASAVLYLSIFSYSMLFIMRGPSALRISLATPGCVREPAPEHKL